MKPVFFRYVVCLLLCSGAVSLYAQTQGKAKESNDSVLVSINGEPITLLDVMLETGDTERELAGMYSGERLRMETMKLRKTVLENIIYRNLIWEEYQRNPFDVPKQEIENLLQQLGRNIGATTRAELEERATFFGVTIDELKEKAKKKIVFEVMVATLCDHQVYVTPKEIFDEYKKNAAEWSIPATVSIRLLQIMRPGESDVPAKLELVKKLKEQLAFADAETFIEAVKEQNSVLNADKGGLMDAIEITKLRPEFAKALKDKKQGDVIGPVETEEGWYFIRLESVKPAARVPFAQASEKIRIQLRGKEIARTRKEHYDRLRAKAVIRYHF